MAANSPGNGRGAVFRPRFLAGLVLVAFLGGCGIQGSPIPPENVPPETPPEAPAKKAPPGSAPSGGQKDGGDLNQEEPEGGFPDQ